MGPREPSESAAATVVSVPTAVVWMPYRATRMVCMYGTKPRHTCQQRLQQLLAPLLAAAAAVVTCGLGRVVVCCAATVPTKPDAARAEATVDIRR